MDAGLIDYILRIVGRLAFMFVLLGAYSLWHLPVLKRHANEFFWLATVLCAVNLIFTSLEFIFSSSTDLFLSLLFNVGSTWVLAIYMNWRAWQIKKRVPEAKLADFTVRVNNLIEELKHGI